MKKTFGILGAVLAVALLMGACGGAGGGAGKADDSKWTAQDKENAVKNCKFGRQKDDPAKVEKLCACYLEKVVALSPSPFDQGKIPLDQVTKLNNDCRVEAGL